MTVVLQLEEKQIPYTIEKINMRCYGDKPADFMRIVPSGLLPVLEYKGQIITESAIIARILEANFPERPLLPPEGSEERSRAERLLKLERTLFSAWLSWLCQSWCEPLFFAAQLYIHQHAHIHLRLLTRTHSHSFTCTHIFTPPAAHTALAAHTPGARHKTRLACCACWARWRLSWAPLGGRTSWALSCPLWMCALPPL